MNTTRSTRKKLPIRRCILKRENTFSGFPALSLNLVSTDCMLIPRFTLTSFAHILYKTRARRVLTSFNTVIKNCLPTVSFRPFERSAIKFYFPEGKEQGEFIKKTEI